MKTIKLREKARQIIQRDQLEHEQAPPLYIDGGAKPDFEVDKNHEAHFAAHLAFADQCKQVQFDSYDQIRKQEEELKLEMAQSKASSDMLAKCFAAAAAGVAIVVVGILVWKNL